MGNPLRALPADNSQKYSLTALDIKKTFRQFLVMLLPMALNAIPNLQAYLGSHMLMWQGVNWTPAALAVIAAVVELGRRFLTGPAAPTPPQAPAASLADYVVGKGYVLNTPHGGLPGSGSMTFQVLDRALEIPSLAEQLKAAGLMVDPSGRLVPLPRK
jgi:hypothetical protein